MGGNRQEHGRGLAAAGVPVVGWSSLDYYWSPRTPERAAADLARILDHYTATWRRSRVIVVGYSFGADVAAFLVNRLPASVKAHVQRVALLGPSDPAAFEFRVASWLGGGGDPRYPTRPELDRLDIPTVCVASRDERDSVCVPASRINPRVRAETLGEGHHFSGQYNRLVLLILQ